MADAFHVEITVKDNLPTLEKAKGEAIERALYAMGTKALEGAVRSISGQYTDSNLAVDTGRLRASLSFITPSGDMAKVPPSMPTAKNDSVEGSKVGDKLDGIAESKTVIVGTNVEYASYVHNGTKRMKARPFLREGIDNTKNQIQSQVDLIFKGEL